MVTSSTSRFIGKKKAKTLHRTRMQSMPLKNNPERLCENENLRNSQPIPKNRGNNQSSKNKFPSIIEDKNTAFCKNAIKDMLKKKIPKHSNEYLGIFEVPSGFEPL